jgi:NADPH-dependent FMN reductase
VLREIAIKDLPLYSSDYDADYPPVARAFKQAIADVDAVLFVTPEYNRSIPERSVPIESSLRHPLVQNFPLSFFHCARGGSRALPLRGHCARDVIEEGVNLPLRHSENNDRRNRRHDWTSGAVRADVRDRRWPS